MRSSTMSKFAWAPIALLAFGSIAWTGVKRTPPAEGEVIQSISANEARYNPGQPVIISVQVTNNLDHGITDGKVTLEFHHLQKSAAPSESQPVNLTVGASKTLTFTWTPPATNFQGYLVTAEIRGQSGEVLDHADVAVDISSTWTKFPRYGFMDEFSAQPSSTTYKWMSDLKNQYIDGIQFYDWQWKHHVPLAGPPSQPAASWRDIANRPHYRATVLDGINAAHHFNMVAMNYNLVYGAWDGYSTDGSGVSPKWGLWTDANHDVQWSIPMPNGWATSAIDMFNPANKSWQNYIYGQESKVFQAYPFDGWQVDQLGDWGARYDWYGNPVNYEQTFVPFLNNAKTVLRKQLVFNDVGAFGLADVASKSRDKVLYVECWSNNGQITYDDIKQVIDEGVHDSNGTKSIVIAAYMDTQYATSFSNSSPGYFSAPGVLLTNATIDAAGGDQIELGDNMQMLNTAYFPNHSLVMSNSLERQIHAYNTFQVAYENLLRGGLKNTTNKVVLKGITTSDDASPNTVWAFTKSNQTYDTIQLINLLGESSNEWQDSNAVYPKPKEESNIQVRYYYGTGTVTNVNLASPDSRNGKSLALHFTSGRDASGNFVTFILSSLRYWDMVYLKKASGGQPGGQPSPSWLG